LRIFSTVLAYRLTGGWLFGYVQARQLAGFQVTIFCFSNRTRVVATMRHHPTNAEICLIPESRLYFATPV
jgi:hypothetical protein